MKEVVGRTVGVIDENGIIVACSEVGKIGESKQRVREELAYSQSSLVLDGYTYRTLAAGSKNDCIVFVEGTDRDSDKTAQMLAVSLGSIKSL